MGSVRKNKRTNRIHISRNKRKPIPTSYNTEWESGISWIIQRLKAQWNRDGVRLHLRVHGQRIATFMLCLLVYRFNISVDCNLFFETFILLLSKRLSSLVAGYIGTYVLFANTWEYYSAVVYYATIGLSFIFSLVYCSWCVYFLSIIIQYKFIS